MMTDTLPGKNVSPGVRAGSDARRVLVVDDDPSFRRIVHLILEKLGYDVLDAGAAQAALEIAARNNNIRILITDVAMPVMGGAELARKIQKAYPHMKVLFISGFPLEAVAAMGVATDPKHFLQKPFQPAVIDARIKALLAGAKPGCVCPGD